MAKRAKINNEDPKINFRIPQGMLDKITNNANEKNVTVSAYMRNLLEKVLQENEEEVIIEPSNEKKVLDSLDFLKLVVWLYTKKEKKERTESPEELDFYINVIKGLVDHLPLHITEEFDKVLAELLNNKRKQYSIYSFEFMKKYGSFGTFDYVKLESYLFQERQK